MPCLDLAGPKSHLALVTMVVAAVLASLAANSLLWTASAEADSSCGNVKAYYPERGTKQYVLASDIHARSMNCRPARHVAKRWAGRFRSDERVPPDHALGFKCVYHRIGSDLGATTCRDGDRRVHFDVYDSSPFH